MTSEAWVTPSIRHAQRKQQSRQEKEENIQRNVHHSIFRFQIKRLAQLLRDLKQYLYDFAEHMDEKSKNLHKKKNSFLNKHKQRFAYFCYIFFIFWMSFVFCICNSFPPF